MNEPPQKQPGVVLILGAGHLAALVVIYYSLGGNHDSRGLSLGLICSQVSLAAIFGALAPLPALIRLPAAFIAAALGWRLVLAGISRPVDAAMSGGWAAMVVLQFSLVALGAVTLRTVLRQLEGRPLSQLVGQYSLSMLLAWMTLIAVILGVLRLAFAAFGWDEKVLTWAWFFHLLILGSFNAAFALVALCGVVGSWRPLPRCLIALAVAIAILAFEPVLMRALFKNLGAQVSDLWILGGMQIGSLFFTLGAVRWAGGLAECPPPLRSPKKT